MVVCYIILHYNDIETTKIAVSKVKAISHICHHIVVVDNFSPNGTGQKLVELFSNDSNVDVLLTNKNLGFARGNNVGYEFAKKKYNPDLMVVMNNDIFIDQCDFEDVMFQYMKCNNVDIAGPSVINLNGINQNPLQDTPLKTFTALKLILGNSIKRIILRPDFLYNIYLRYKRKGFQQKNICHQQYLENIKQPILHGSCIVFGLRYIKNEEFAFRPCTFMYAEEFLLYDYANQKRYTTGIAINAHVKHLEDKSTDATFTNAKSKIFFIYKNQANSLFKLICLRAKYFFLKNEDEDTL